MGCGVANRQIRELDRALSTMRRFGIDELSGPFRQLSAQRGKLLSQVGFKFPRTISSLLKLLGLSPGTITLWHDVESGWMSEAREKPGAPPVYKAVTDEVAMALLKGELTKELEQVLMAPDDYYGE